MARTIESPGVQINEIDLSLNASLPVGTKVLVHGFASQGPTNELIYISNKTDLDETFFGGAGPSNAAEQYFYHTCAEVLNSPATLIATRLPYGSAGGTGMNGEYAAVIYPLLSGPALSTLNDGTTATIDDQIAISLGEPKSFPITETQYENILAGQITWAKTISDVSSPPDWTSITAVGEALSTVAGLIVVNDAKTTVNEYFEGYYIGFADSFAMSDNSISGYNSITSVKASNTDGKFTPLTGDALNFTLTGGVSSNGSISENIERSYGYVLPSDGLATCIYKLRRDTSADDPDKLVYIRAEKFVGTIENKRGEQTVKNLETTINENSRYVKLFINPLLKDKTQIDQVYNDSKNLVSLGAYKSCQDIDDKAKAIGVLPTKIDRALVLAENVLDLDIDIVLDGGLSTIWAYVSGSDTTDNNAYDDAKDVHTNIENLQNSISGGESAFAQAHREIFNKYNTFCKDTRKDCIHISDPIRGIFVQGADTKVMSMKSKNFSTNIFTPMKNLYNGANSNYACTYANWVRKFDNAQSKYVWLPFSGFQAAIMARMDANLQPWYAPFGLNNGLISTITDIAVRPNQKQNDMFYRIGINPVVFFTGDGFVVWGQKTLQTKPSAFDRINVRRLFLVLERATMKVMRYFVGEPNTVFTRTRVGNVLRPIFDLAKNNEGVYDYMVVCDERNNTADVIDNNEMKVDIYLKPVRTAEYILVTFFATKTSQDFNELVG